MDEFPTNSASARKGEKRPLPNSTDKKVERIATGEVVRRKKPLGRRFADVFVGGDTKGVMSFVALDVLVPAAKDMVADAMTTAVERMLFGESRSSHRRSSGGSPFGRSPSNGYVSYNRFSNKDRDQPRPMSRRARASHDFDDIIMTTRVEAEEVISRLFDLISQYESASVADLYSLVGVTGNYTDDKWGWMDIRGAGVTRIKDGYLLDLPKPEPLD